MELITVIINDVVDLESDARTLKLIIAFEDFDLQFVKSSTV